MKHLQCLVEELKALEGVLNLGQSKNSDSANIKESMNNINVTVLELKVRYYFICSPGNKINGRAFQGGIKFLVFVKYSCILSAL